MSLSRTASTCAKVAPPLQLAIAAVDCAALTTYYTLNDFPEGRVLLEQIGNRYLFPINTAAAITQAALAWTTSAIEENQAGQRFKHHQVFNAVVETGAAIAITAAVIGVNFFPQESLGKDASIIFAVQGATRAALNIILASYNFGKAAGLQSHVALSDQIRIDRKRFNSRCQNHIILAMLGVIGATASTLVLVMSKSELSVIGIAAGVLSIAYIAAKTAEQYCCQRSVAIDDEETARGGLLASDDGSGSDSSISSRRSSTDSAVNQLAAAVLAAAPPSTVSSTTFARLPKAKSDSNLSRQADTTATVITVRRQSQ